MTLAVDHRYGPASTWTAICRADESDKTLVREDGALLYGFRSRTWLVYAFERVVEFGLAGQERAIAVEQHMESAASGIVVTTLRYANADLVLRTFRHVADGRGFDVVQWEIRVADGVDELGASLHVEIHDRSAWFSSGPRGASRHVLALADPALADVEWFYDAHDPAGADWEVEAAEVALRSRPQRLAVAQSRGFTTAAAFATLPEHLPGGATARGSLVVPLDGRDPGELDADAALAGARAYWRDLLPAALPLEVPDRGIQALVEASARNLLQAREVRDGRRVFQVGHTIYRDFWIADSFFMLEAVRYLGLEDAADESLAALEEHVGADGSIVALGDVGHIKETAIAIAMLVRQAELAGDPGRLDPWWERIDRAVEHIADLHASTLDLPEGAAARGLMPPAFGDGGVAGRRAEYTTVLWALAGLRIAVDAAERSGRASAGRYRAVYDGLRTQFDDHSRRHRRPLSDGHTYLPMVLDGGDHHIHVDAPSVACEDAIRPETATWALAHAIYPGEVFGLDDEIVREFLHLLELRDDDEQVPATTGWLPYRALWTYYASFAAHAFLWAGRPDKAIEYLYGFANHAAPTGVWREEQPLSGSGHGTINGDMPHNWASAEFIRLVRNLLVFERGDELVLLPAVPDQWLSSGRPICVETPTRFGRVRLDVATASSRIEVEIAPGALTPARVALHVPPGVWRVGGRRVEGPCVSSLDR